MSEKQDNFMTIIIYLAFCFLCVIGIIGKVEGLNIDVVFINMIICAIEIIIDYIERTEKKLEAHINKLYKNGVLHKGDKND